MLTWITVLLLSAGGAAALSAAFGPCAAWWFVLRIPLLFLASYLCLLLLWTLLLSLISLFIDKKKPMTKAHHGMRRFVAEAMEFVLLAGRIRIRAEGLERFDRTKPFLLISNHRSMIDPMLPTVLMKGKEIIFICKPEIVDMPVVGRYAHICGYPLIDRNNNRQALKTILHAVDILREEQTPVGIYPEGTRNKTDEPLLPLHPGSFSIAKRAGVPVVIAATQGTAHAIPRFLWRGTKVSFRVVDVITPEQASALSTQELAERAKETLEAALKN
jgi:1-acyl-sn-glycerol-3-phosphate acyltransferase